MQTSTRLLSLLLLTGATLCAGAQITIDESYLPKVGDEETTYVEEGYTDPNGNLAKRGANQTWRFETATSDRSYVTVVRSARDGRAAADFPDATLTINTESYIGKLSNTSELYLRRGTRGLDLLGVASTDASASLPSLRLGKPLLYYPSPLSAGTLVADGSQSRFAFGSEVLTELTGDPSYAKNVDSVRLRVDQSISFEVDGWGTVNVEDIAGVDALRLKTTNSLNQVLEVKVRIFGWIDVAAIGLIPDSLLPAYSLRTVDYAFLTARRRYPAYRIRVDSAGRPASLEYANAAVVGVAERPEPESELRLRVDGERLAVSVTGGGRGGDQVSVYGTDGRLIVSRPLSGAQAGLDFDTGTWASGLHLVTLWRHGAVAATQRVLISH